MLPCRSQVEKYDTINFQYNVFFKEVYITSIKKYVPATGTGLKDAHYRQASAIKRLKNGRIIIERYGRKYGMLGQ